MIDGLTLSVSQVLVRASNSIEEANIDSRQLARKQLLRNRTLYPAGSWLPSLLFF
jgi:hypothetical protein